MTDPLRDAIEALRMPPRVGTLTHHAMRTAHNAALDAVLALIDAQPARDTLAQMIHDSEDAEVTADAVLALFKEVPDV